MQEDSPLYEAQEELKRVSHSLTVTLKYTRTCDVIKSIIRRLIVTFDYGMIALMEDLHRKKKIKTIPLTPFSRAEETRKQFARDIIMQDYIHFYLLLKKIDTAESTKREEFRKNVTLVVMQDDEVIEVDVPMLQGYYAKTKEFVIYLQEKFF